MRRIALLIAVGFVVVLSSAAALAVQGDRAGQADQMDSCLAKHGWPYGLDALRVIERRVGHPNGLVRICELGNQADQMKSCLAKHGWPYGVDALRVIERRVGHPNGLVRICEREISNEMH